MKRDPIPVPPPFTTVDEVLEGLLQLEETFLARRDRRAVFVTAYAVITRTLGGRLGTGYFLDDAWVRAYLVAFANFYRQALTDYEGGRRSSVPRAWQQSFDTSLSGLALVMQDLILGINAHINRDLGFALLEAGITENRETRYRDHTQVNAALREATEEVQDRIIAMYAAGLGSLDHLLGQLDEQLTVVNFRIAREGAWASGLALAAATPGTERALVGAVLDERAVALGRMILLANATMPWLIELLRRVEQRQPWWEWLQQTAHRSPKELKGTSGPEPTDLDEVIQKLGELIRDFDRERNRLSIYATVYQAITKRVKASVEAGKFQDPKWIVRLDVAFAARYFRIIEAYRTGQPGTIPQCWLHAIESVVGRQTMVAQDIAVQIAPRVIYDLPITLVEAGLDQNLDDRKQDYEATYALFIDELDCIQKMIARKYSKLTAFYDALGGPLDEAISNHLYTRARREAWSDGLALQATASASERERLMRRFDQKARQVIERVLFHQMPPMNWIAQALRNAEDVFSGDWSSTVEECT